MADPARAIPQPDESAPMANFEQFRLFRGVRTSVIEDTLRRCKERRLEPGDVLITRGEVNSSLFVLTEGRLSIHLASSDEEPIAFVESGETVGELSVLDRSQTCAYVVAAEPCRLVELDEYGLWALIESSHRFAINLLMTLAERLRANNDTVSESVRKREAYERAAMFDSLTDVHSRRWLDMFLPDISRQHSAAGIPLSLAVIDVDHFKRFNDNYGHSAGDAVLRTVARTVAAHLRPTDHVARFGGEEFVVLLPATSVSGACTASDRLRQAVAEAESPMEGDQVLPSVTISIGVAQLIPGEGSGELLARADAALYRAKENGRNRVER